MAWSHASHVGRPDTGSAPPSKPVNPLLDAFYEALTTDADIDSTRAALITRYGFAIPTEEALDAIGRSSPAGVVEIGAGTGYWAHALQQRGVDVAAYDIAPAPSPENQWFAGTPPWHPVHRDDHTVAGRHPDRTLLIVWPTKNEIWAAVAVERYHDAGGACVVYAGERPGGRTGDDVFHARLGELTTCVQCEYGSTTSPCVCSVDAQWDRTAMVALPHWPGYDDDLHIYTRRGPLGPMTRQRQRAKPRRAVFA